MKLSLFFICLTLSLNLLASPLSDGLNACLKSGVVKKVGVADTTMTKLGMSCEGESAQKLFEALKNESAFVTEKTDSEIIDDFNRIANIYGSEETAELVEYMELRSTTLFFGETGLSQVIRDEVLVKPVDGEIINTRSIYRGFIELDVTNDLITRLDLEN